LVEVKSRLTLSTISPQRFFEMSSTLASPLAKIFGVVIFTFFALTAAARAGERTITAAEANGTWRHIESKSEIKILNGENGRKWGRVLTFNI